MLPWFTYNYVDARPVHAVAGRRRRPRPVGRLVAGARGPAALQNELTHLADDIDDRADARSPRRRRSPRASSCRPGRCSSTSISGRTSGASGPSRPIRSTRAVARVDGRRGIPARRPREHPRATRRRIWPTRLARGAVRPLGGRDSDPLQRHQRAADRRSSARAGRCRPLICRWPRSCGGCRAAARADASAEGLSCSAPIVYITGGALAAAHRSAPVAAGASRSCCCWRRSARRG